VVGAHADLAGAVDAWGEPAAGLERLGRQRRQQGRLDGEHLPDGARPGPDAPGVVGDVPGIDQGVELGQRVDLGDRDEVIAAEPADLTFDAAFLVGALQSGLAVEGLDRLVRPECDPALGFHPLPGEPQHLGDGGFEVVVADLAAWHPAQYPEGVLVAFEEGFLAAGGEDASLH
jgi:hypothetical protein